MKKAMTTAELLIAMTIIGIIAILVLPGFIEDYNKKIHTARIKKTYMLIESAIEQAKFDNNVSSFNLTKYSKNGNEQEFLNKYFRAKEGSSFASAYESLDGHKSNYTAPTTSIILSDGTSLSMSCSKNNPSLQIRRLVQYGCTFTVDTNGKAEPNVGGRDMFQFLYDNDDNIVTMVSPFSPVFNTGGEEYKCAESPLGVNCLKLLMQNNWKMDY